MSQSRILPWVAAAAVAALALYYFFGQTPTVEITAPRDESAVAPRRDLNRAPADEPTAEELAPAQATASDAQAAIVQMKRDQEQEIKDMKPEPSDTGDGMSMSGMKPAVRGTKP